MDRQANKTSYNFPGANLGSAQPYLRQEIECSPQKMGLNHVEKVINERFLRTSKKFTVSKLADNSLAGPHAGVQQPPTKLSQIVPKK